ncbi:hypothetical protein HDU87_001759 [Geranomyces variabilis]|uniref:UBX domain-containing protein n=1 Tax=Geranomyces variabilis TaxID=109894 RepID=A0AAD5XNN2_9FUNG|nr:hypothetical protein HDU87_001759 [Geranomyces variabilis]
MADFVDNESIMGFIEITGSDPDVAKNYLQVAEGDVEQAVSLFLENGGAPLHAELPKPAAGASSSSKASNSANSDQFSDDGVRAPIAPKREALFAPDDVDMYHPGPRHAPPLGGPTGRLPPPQIHHHVSSLSSDPNSRLAVMFAAPTAIMYQAHNMHQVREEGKRAKKWIMLTLNEPSEFGSQILNRDLWKDETVQTLIKEQFVFVYWGTQSPQAREHKTLYPVESFPYFCIVDPITGERMQTWYRTVKPQEFLEEVNDFLNAHSLYQTSSAPAPKKKKTSRAKTVTEMTEDEQLALALAASVQESSSSPRPIVIDDDEDDVVADEMDEDTTQPVVQSSSDSKTIVGRLNEEPPNGPEATRIQFRLPDGTRKVRRFSKSDTVRVLFEYVRADVPEAKGKLFELMNFREPLMGRQSERIDEANLAGASISVDFL